MGGWVNGALFSVWAGRWVVVRRMADWVLGWLVVGAVRWLFACLLA